MSFQRIGPASRMAQARAPLGLYRYPQKDDWNSLQPDPKLHSMVVGQLQTTTRGLLGLVGAHGCGKTFYLLYLGHWWEASAPPKTLAFYAPAPATLSPADVVGRWREIGEGRKCLWIIDDAHTDAEMIVRHLIAEFEELALQGHWLIIAGWSAPAIEEAPILQWALSEETVHLAFRAKGYEELATDELVHALARSRLGLRQILWAACYRPDALARTDLLEQEWAAEMTRSLSQPARERLATLARLRFLGLPFLPRTEQETKQLEEISSTTGLAHQVDGRPGGFEIPDDEIAQLLLRRDIGEGDDSAEIVRSFLLPLGPYISDLLNQRILELPGRFLHALRSRTRRDLRDWIEASSRNGEVPTDPLINDFLNDDFLARVRSAVVGHPDLTQAVRLVLTVESGGSWARETAIAMLRAMRELPRALETDLPTWRALGTLAHLADDAAVRTQMSRAARAEGILSALRQTTGAERWQLLDTAALVGEEAYRAFLGVVREVLVEEMEVVRPSGAWHRLATLAKRDAKAAVQLLEALSPDFLGHLLFSAPAAARSFLARINPSHYRPERRRVQRLFDGALRARTITDEDLDGWSDPRDLIAFVALARRQRQAIDTQPLLTRASDMVHTTNPAILTELCHDVGKFGADTRLRRALAQTMLETLRQGRDPLVERLEGLGRLAPNLLTEDLIATLHPRWRGMEPSRMFRFLWWAVAVSGGRSDSARRLAREVLAEPGFVASADAPLIALAISGLCLFVLGEELDARELAEFAPLNALREPTLETPPPTSPPLTVCQVLALARSVSAAATPGYGSLAWLVGQVAQPASPYHRAWHRMVASHRRFALEILSSALSALGSGDLAFLAEALALGIVRPEQDDIWDDHLAVRLEAARFGAGNAIAVQLLDRRCDAWIGIIRTRILQTGRPLPQGTIKGVLQFLERVVDLAVAEGEPAKTCARKLIDATIAQLGAVRQEELRLLLGRLEGA